MGGVGGAKGRPCPEEESRVKGGWGRRGQKEGKIEAGLEEEGPEAEQGGGGPKVATREEPEGGVTQRKITGVVLKIGGT